MRLVFSAVALLVMTLGFGWNTFRVADQGMFEGHNNDMESYVVGRLVQSRDRGIFSSGGLTGFGNTEAPLLTYADNPFPLQFNAFNDGATFASFSPYLSQIGGQGMFLSLWNRLWPAADGSAQLARFHLFNSVATSAALLGILLWLYHHTGPATAWAALAGIVGSHWLVLFGRNIWWSTWAFYLPMLAVIYALRRGPPSDTCGYLRLAAWSAGGVAVKCFFNGYEFITTTLLMMLVPVLLHCLAQGDRPRRILAALAAAGTGALAGVLVTMAVLCTQIAIVKGGFTQGIDHIVASYVKRTHAHPDQIPGLVGEERKALEIDVGSVLETHFSATYIDVGAMSVRYGLAEELWLPFSYRHLTWVTLLIAIALLLRGAWRNTPQQNRLERAFVAATLFALLAPLSWFIIFKAHSYVHLHMDSIVWQMPFTLLAFALLGLLLQRLATDWKSTRPSPAAPSALPIAPRPLP